MSDLDEVWKPGSFTKNFSWGDQKGLRELYDSIRIGFGQKLEPVPRRLFRERVAGRGRPDYIPINFFLLNMPVPGEDLIVVDELVFQALTARHSIRFDKLALFAFNLSIVGRWQGAQAYQKRPALWAHHYVRDRVARDFIWDTNEVSADDIERFVVGDERYQAEGTRKLSTNLNHLYRIGRLSEFATPKIERWWVDALFLALDRIIADRRIDKKPIAETRYGEFLDDVGFQDLTGRRSLEKKLAARHLIRLYIECGGPDRFSSEAVLARERATVDPPERGHPASADEDVSVAIHPTNLRIVKSIPAMCAVLAICAGFEVLTAVQMRNFDPEQFLHDRTREALARLEELQVRPTLSVAELLELTREQ